MRNEDAVALRMAVDELTRGGEEVGGARDDGGEKRMFMAGRHGPDSSRIRYGAAARPPVDGPWDLALVVRPR